MERKHDFWTDPRYGSAMWPITTAVFFFRSMFGLALFAAFFSGVSIYRWFKQ